MPKLKMAGINQNDLVEYLEEIKEYVGHRSRQRNGVIGGNHTMGIGTSDTTMVRMDGVCRYYIDGVEYVQTAVEGDLHTAGGAGGEVTENLWGAWRLMLDAAGAIQTQRAGEASTAMAFESEEAALLSLASIPITASMAVIGYWTCDAAAGGFTPGTDLPYDTDAQVDNDTYFNALVPPGDNGLTAAPSVGLSAGSTTDEYAFGTINARTNGKNIAELSADTTQTFAQADVITTAGQFAGHLFVTDVAGTNVTSLAATGVAGAAITMTYATALAANTALDTITLALPGIFTIIGRSVTKANKASFTFDTDDVAGVDSIATWTDTALPIETIGLSL